MKKVICLIVALVMIFCLCACGDTNTTNNDNNGNSKSNSATDNSSKTETIDINTKEAYVAKWVKERTDAEPYAMNLTLNADGTGASGKSGGIEWIFDEATKQATIIIVYPDGSKSDPTTAKLKEDGKLYWNNNVKVQLGDGTILDVEQVVLEREK